MRAARYLIPVIIFMLAIISFNSIGLACYTAMLFAWVVVPGLELLLAPDPTNLSATEEALAKDDPVYDWVLYSIVVIHIATLFYFLNSMQSHTLSLSDKIGRIMTMGLLCGTFGINLGHELGHRVKPHEKWLARIALMSSLYIHFYIEHNKGHHKRVATPEDPSTARFNEPIYEFWFRSIINCYTGAWKIANRETGKKGKPVFSLHNEMLQVQLIQLLFVVLIYLLFGFTIMLYFFMAAVFGILLLESVNYIEHYGLIRKHLPGGKYERPMPEHSWNSDHLIGRLLLFELSRHSDHHYLASRKYQVLRHHDDSPQMPTGYPGMILLALVPPLWFRVMNRKVIEQQVKSAIA